MKPKTHRVFVSYARKDGETFAKALRETLEGEGVSVLQDRVRLEGGKDWWLQITDAIESVDFMLLVMTPAAMASQVVRKEWRYARQQGVCVYPIKADAGIDIGGLPRWMRDKHFFDIGLDIGRFTGGSEWATLLGYLRAPCTEERVPFMCEDLPHDFVPRARELDALLARLLNPSREEPVAITAALKGAGGYGKTTLARALCHDERVQQAYDDGILWVTLGERFDNPLEKVESLIFALSGAASGAPTLEAAQTRLRELLADRDILLVIDDVWQARHLTPFLQGGEGRCTRLITTRNGDTLPSGTVGVAVDAMEDAEAVRLLSWGLPAEDKHGRALGALAERLGNWALLLKLANGVLRGRIEAGQSLADAIAYANKALDRRGLVAFDGADDAGRHAAVRATLGISLELLTAEDRAAFGKLAIFKDDVDVPLATLEPLWGVDDFDAEERAVRLINRSLLLRLDLDGRTLRLHDVVRQYLIDDLRAQGTHALPAAHATFLDAYGVGDWSMLPPSEPYLWRWLAYHLVEARRADTLRALLLDLRWLRAKLAATDPQALVADCDVWLTSPLPQGLPSVVNPLSVYREGTSRTDDACVVRRDARRTHGYPNDGRYEWRPSKPPRTDPPGAFRPLYVGACAGGGRGAVGGAGTRSPLPPRCTRRNCRPA